MRDETSAVYAAEELWMSREPLARIKFGDWIEVQPYYVKIAAAFRNHGVEIYPPTVRPRKGALKAHYDSSTQSVYIPPYSMGGSWALKTGVAIHEFAHHVHGVGGHGPEFRAAMVECLKMIGWDHGLLEECYANVGLSTDSHTEGIADKVNKLLTHAERAATPEEQKTYFEKAESLATANSINIAMMRKKQADRENQDNIDRPITGQVYSLEALPNVTYRNLAVELASAIRQTQGTNMTIWGKSSFLHFYGYAEDIAVTELLVTRITPMMFDAADDYLQSNEHRESGVHTTSARISFCQSFICEVGMRLREAARRTEAELIQELPEEERETTALVLRGKEVEVYDHYLYELKRNGVKGTWKGSNTSTMNLSASAAGTRAGAEANIFGRKQIG